MIHLILAFLAYNGRVFLLFLEQIGSFFTFFSKIFAAIFSVKFHFQQFFIHLRNIGFFSIPVVALTAIFTGAVLVLQSYIGFSRFSAASAIPNVVVVSITRELAPVLTGLIVAGRAGSAIAAEISTMRVSEQVDALITLAINPFKYLIVPRVLASIIVLPVLVILADIIGVFGGYLVATKVLNFNQAMYLNNTLNFLTNIDVISGLVKAAFFGLVISLSGCYQGYKSKRGAEGVGKATTNAVVAASIFILLSNYVITELFFYQ